MDLIKKLGNGIIDLFVPFIRPLVKEIIRNVLLEKLQEADEEAYKTVLVSTYPAIDVHAESAAAKTDTPIDDAVVAGFKDAIEEAAAAIDLELPNLDDD